MSEALHEEILAPVSGSNLRNGEGAVVELHDGRILLAWDEYHGGQTDWSIGQIVARVSEDRGRTWGEQYILVPNRGKMNTICPCFVRLHSGPIGLAYFVKNDEGDCRTFWQKSTDEGKSWTEPVSASPEPLGYHQIHNDRAVQLTSGRILLPQSTAAAPRFTFDTKLISFCSFSDDEGETWRHSTPPIDAPMRGAMEPLVLERNDGSVLMWLRTQLGFQYKSISTDGGETWSTPEPDYGLLSSEAPLMVKRCPTNGDLLAVWNRVYDPYTSHWRRTPLNSAISKNDGATWECYRAVECDPDRAYSYPSIHFQGDEVLLTYYQTQKAYDAPELKINILPLAWFYEAEN